VAAHFPPVSTTSREVVTVRFCSGQFSLIHSRLVGLCLLWLLVS
jgi:hypothetical protein